MNNHSARTPKGTPLMRIGRATKSKVHVSKSWYYRTRRSGKTIYFPLGRNWSEACAKADEIDFFLRLPSATLVEAMERFGRNAQKNSPKVAPIGAVLESLAIHADGLSLAPSSFNAYRLCLLRLIRVGLSHRLERPVSLDEARAETPLILTPRLVLDYKEAILKGRSGSKDALSAKRSMNSVLRNAKAVFSPAAREVYAFHGLVVPDLSPFLATLPFRRVGVDYALPSAELIKRVMTLTTTKPKEWDENVHTMATLAALAGLRKSEISFARWSWLHGGARPYIHVQIEENFVPKDGPRRVPISVETYRLLMSRRRPDSIYVIGGSDNFRVEECARITSALLRAEGITADKPLHELRKWFGSQAACRYGLTQAQRLLGHSNQQLTSDYYADLEFPEELLRFWPQLSLNRTADGIEKRMPSVAVESRRDREDGETQPQAPT